jgi:hypothetical protein
MGVISMKKVMAIAAVVAAILTSPNNAGAMGDAPMDHKQSLVPPNSVEMYLDGFHNYAGQDKLAKDKQLQLRVAHYCKQVRPDLFQCIVYNGTGKDARLIGVEYVISDAAYKALPEKERKMWHPHDGEVESGMLRMPGMEPEAEKKTLDFLKSTWGKTWHAWQPDQEIPLGEPTLMWAVPKDDANAKTKAAMEKRLTDPNY